jgi:hypothetical protein
MMRKRSRSGIKAKLLVVLMVVFVVLVVVVSLPVASGDKLIKS